MSEEIKPPPALARWLNGKRTYLTVGAILVVGILAKCGLEIPDYIWAALYALGLGFLRAGVKKAEL